MIHKTSRRQFLTQSSLAALGITLLPSFNRKVSASDRIRLAHIGVGPMGNNHMKWFANLPEVEIVAICDVDELRVASTLKTLQELRPGNKAQGYTDFRKVLERKDIDAITCATPDHWHAQIACLAFESGKDVYGEKPLSYSVQEGQTMLKYGQKYNKVFQMGNHIHASDNFHRVVELIQGGAIGDVKTVRLWKTGSGPDLGFPKVERAPSTLNWDMWLGPAPYTDYMKEKCHFTYRYFLDYSGGMFADFWCHIADVAFWALRPKGLHTISARGEAPKDISNTPKWLDIDYEFDNLTIHWTTTPPNVPGATDKGIGAYFEGSKGTLLCDYGTKEITLNGEKLSDLESIPKTIVRSPGHQQNFIDSIKSRTQPESNLEYAREMTLPMHLGLISYRLGRSLKWDSQDEKFINDKEANRLLKRKPRKKWDLL